MSACPHCLRAAVLHNEATGFAENRLLDAKAARRLLAMQPDAMLAELRGHWPEVERRLERRVASFLAGDIPEIWSICRHDVTYPDALGQLHDPPAALFGVGSRGRFERLLEQPAVAIVGSRRATATGRQVATDLARDLSSAGVTVVSGMAMGIDGAAHRGALSAGSATIAVLASGPDRAYPRMHAALHREITAGGAVVSERPPRASTQRWGFPARNRIIAALSTMTIVVEGERKSGALHTVDFALQLGLEVGAVPGSVLSPLSDAPNDLLRSGMTVIRCAEDVLDSLSIGSVVSSGNIAARSVDALSASSQTVLDRVAAGDGSPAAIAAELAAGLREVVRALGELELQGWITRDHLGEYTVTKRPKA